MEAQASELITRDLNVFYGQRRILKNISVAVESNRVTALVGPSGCGKSTLLLALAGLLDATSGAQLSGTISKRKKKNVGIVFQKPMPFRLSIFDNVALALKERGLSTETIEERVKMALDRAGLWSEVQDRLSESATKLSGGQQQRLCLARTLALEPAALLLDEPCSSLDPLSTQAIEETIRELSKTTSVLIVTHNLSQAKRLASTVLVMWNRGQGGEIIETGDVTIFDSARSELAKQYLAGRLG